MIPVASFQKQHSCSFAWPTISRSVASEVSLWHNLKPHFRFWNLKTKWFPVLQLLMTSLSCPTQRMSNSEMHPDCWRAVGSNHWGYRLKLDLLYGIWRKVYPNLRVLKSRAAIWKTWSKIISQFASIQLQHSLHPTYNSHYSEHIKKKHSLFLFHPFLDDFEHFVYKN